MRRDLVVLTVGLALAASLALVSSASAKPEDWQDTQGNSFRGEPVEVLGPLALFRTGPVAARRVQLRNLAPADCVRFHEAVSRTPARALDWSKAGSTVSRELLGSVFRVEKEKLESVDLKGRPEPEIFIVFYASHGIGESWGMMGRSEAHYQKLQKAFPNMIEAVFFGIGEDSWADHSKMAVGMNVPWLVTSLNGQSSMETISAFAPIEGAGMTVLTRNGIPLLSAQPGDNEEAIKKVFADITVLLNALRPDNPRSWPDRAHYLRAVQQTTHRTGRADPLLVGDPFRADGLRQRGVLNFTAVVAFDADGKVTSVTLQPDGKYPEAMAAPLAEALRSIVIVPGVENGALVSGVYTYRFTTPQ